MKKLAFLVPILLLVACSNDNTSNHRDIQVTVKDIVCEEGRLYSDSGCTLITESDEIYYYGTDLINLKEGQSAVLSVKGFNKIKKIRYVENIVD